MTLRRPPFNNLAFRAFLFDMDGTLLSSIVAAERVWSAWATKQGLDVAACLQTIHGQRAVDTIAKMQLPGVDAVKEAKGITLAEIADQGGVEEIAGARAFLNSLPADKWALVTSAPLKLAHARLKAAGIPLPSVVITAEDVKIGKPHPKCYQLAAEKLGVAIKECLVFEDAPAGIQAAEAAGAHVMVVTATHTHRMETPHFSIANFQTLVAKSLHDGSLELIDPS